MIKTFLGFILMALIFSATLGLSLSQLQKPEFLSEQARRVNLYGRLTSNLPKLVDDQILKDSPFGEEDLMDIVQSSVDSETFYAFLDQYLKEHVDWLAGRTNTLDFTYDLAQVKARAREKANSRIIAKYEGLPTCNSTQISSWSAENTLPSCKLPSTSIRSNDVHRILETQTDSFLETIPGEISSKPTPSLEIMREQASRAVKATQIAIIAAAAFIVLYLAIYRRKAFLSLAFIFLLTGLIEAAFGLIAWDWVGKIVVDTLPDNKATTLPIIVDVVTAVLEVLKKSLANTSIILLIIGGVFLLLAIFYRPKRQTLQIPSK